MKLKSTVTLVLTAVLAFGVIGCKKNMDRVSPLPGYGAGKMIADAGPENRVPGITIPEGNRPLGEGMPPMVAPPKTDTEGNNPLSKRDITGRQQDREKFRAQTLYFDFDRSNVKASEAHKVQEVANRFKAENPESDLLIEGHCDERGTEGYNQALGERRAIAVRDMLITLGVPSEHIHTASLGKDRPIDPGHNEAAWKQNRRGEFILVMPR